jgi:hypothetical protein
MTVAIIGFASALLGAVLGSGTTWYLERRREKRQRTIAKAAVVLELALNSSALQAAAIDRQIRRSELTTIYWQRFGPELITFLPDYLVKAMYLLLEDGFDSVRHAYGHMKKGIHPVYWEAAQTLMLSWAYHADRINQMISEYSKTKKVVLPGGPDEEMFLRVLAEAHTYALEKVRSHGLPTDIQIMVPDDADLSVPPEMQPDSGKHIEFMKVDPTGMFVPTTDGAKEGQTT